MISFSKAMQTWLDNHSHQEQKFNLQKASFFSSRTFIAFDSQAGWQIRELTFVQQLLRNLFGMYKETHKAYVQKAFNEVKINKLDLRDAKTAFIINQIKRVFALQFPEESPITFLGSFAPIPQDVYPQIMDFKYFSVKDLIAFKRTCYAFNNYIYANKELMLNYQAGELGSDLEKIISQEYFDCWDRNAWPALCNLREALKLYGEKGDLTQKLPDVIHGHGMSGCDQPETVGGTFKIAQNAKGGFQSFLQYAKKEINAGSATQTALAKYKEFVPIAERICQLLPKLIEA